MKGNSAKASTVLLGLVLLCGAALGGGYYAGRYVIGEEYLKKNASQVRTPERLPVTPQPSSSARARDAEPVVTISPIHRLRPEPEAESDDSEGEESTQPAEEDAAPKQLTIQLGSFADKANADLLAEDLKQRGFSTSTATVQQDGRALHRVGTGAYTTREQAEAAAQELRRLGYNALIVPKE